MKWQMVRGPCPPNCPKRKAGSKEEPSCHTTCKKYAAFRREREKEYKRTRREGELKDYLLTEIRKNGRNPKFQ